MASHRPLPGAHPLARRPSRSPGARHSGARLAAVVAVCVLAAAAIVAFVRQVGNAGSAAAPPAVASAGALPLAGIAELLAGHSSDWRVARLREHPAVMVIEFPDLREQGAAMNRIAAFVQKAGAPRDRVLDDDELAALIARSGDNSQTFYQGHDYDADALARFFAQVHAQGVALNAHERRLEAELRTAGVLAPPGTAPALRALITFTAEQRDDPSTAVDEGIDALRREAVLRHEASHARFYTRSAYREHSIRFWREVLDEAQREGVRRFLAGLGYDRADEMLMINEAQAFLMNTPDPRAFGAADVGMSPATLAALREQFWRTLPPEPDDAAPPPRR